MESSCTYPRPDWCEQDMTQYWWQKPVQVVRTLLQTPGLQAGQIKAVSVSGLFPAMGPTDKSGVPLANAILYSDNAPWLRWKKLTLPRLADHHRRATPKLLWFLRNRRELAARMKMFFDAPTTWSTGCAGRTSPIPSWPDATGPSTTRPAPGAAMPASASASQWGSCHRSRRQPRLLGTVHAEAAEGKRPDAGHPCVRLECQIW